MKTTTIAVPEVDEEYAEIAHAVHEARTARARLSGRSSPAGGQKVRYRMRCPRCALGLVEIISGPVVQEKCTTCGSMWDDPAELLKIAKNDRTGFFQPLD